MSSRGQLDLQLDRQILIVDDVQTNVALLEMMLRRAGYVRVTSTTDSRETYELCEKFRPDLLLLDLSMPHMDGYEVMALLADQRSDPTYLPILVLTADATPEAKRTALSLGAMDFLTKPFDVSEVILRVGNLLEVRRLHLALESHNENREEPLPERSLSTALPRAEQTAEGWPSAWRLASEQVSLTVTDGVRDDVAVEHLRWLSEHCAQFARSLRSEHRRRELISIADQLHALVPSIPPG